MEIDPSRHIDRAIEAIDEALTEENHWLINYQRVLDDAVQAGVISIFEAEQCLLEAEAYEIGKEDPMQLKLFEVE